MRTPTAHGTVDPSQLALLLACLFLVALPAPGLVGLPGGASLALVIMLVSLPIWYETARARMSPFDPAATRTVAVVLACAGFLILWSMLSTFGAQSPIRAGRYLSTLVAAFAIYFLVRGTLTQGRLVFYVDVVMVGLAVTSALSILAYEVAPLHRIIFADTDRAAGLFKNSNQFGMTISTTIPAIMGLILARRQRRGLRVACLLVMFLGLIASGSKTNLILAWISILAMFCGYSIVVHTGAKRIVLLALCLIGSVGVAGLGIVALNLLNPRALVIMTKFLSSDGEVDSLMTRSFLWAYSFDQFVTHPLLGQGAGQRIDIFYRAADVSHSHNVLLDYMRTLGAPGLVGVSIMIGTMVVLCLMSIGQALGSKRTASSATRLICLGLSISSLTYILANMSSDSFGPSTSPFFWLFFYLAAAARRPMLPGSPEASGASRRSRARPVKFLR